MENREMNHGEHVAELMRRARDAQRIAEGYDQARVDELTAALAWAACDEAFRREAAKMLVEESKIGIEEDKFQKIRNKALGVYRDMKDEKSVGVVRTDSELGLVTYIKPMGVVGAVIPITNGEATPIVKALWTLKSRNALIMTPHPNAKNTCLFVTNYIRGVLRKYHAPEDLVQVILPEFVSRDCSAELLKRVDFVVATGGTPMIRAAYLSGTPTIGVGTGNVTTYIDDTADLSDAAHKIMLSKVFDNSSSCSSENSAVVNESVYDAFVAACKAEGGHLVREGTEDHDTLKRAVWPNWPEDHRLNRHVTGKSAREIIALSGISAPEDTAFLLVEENGGIGHEFPFTGEKLCPITTLLKARDLDDALTKMEAILEYQGAGHSCGIHTQDDHKVHEMAARMKVSRILVNQPQSLGNSGAWFNGMPITMSLGCGTWGHNSTSENITWKDIVNYTVVSWPLEAIIPTEEELFSESIRNA